MHDVRTCLIEVIVAGPSAKKHKSGAEKSTKPKKGNRKKNAIKTNAGVVVMDGIHHPPCVMLRSTDMSSS